MCVPRSCKLAGVSETAPEPRVTRLPGPSRREPPPTTRQVYALAHALVEDAGLPWPATRAEISALISRLRDEA
jgi:hypothetical protein